MKTPITPPIALSALLLAAACAKGGAEDRPQSEVRITSTHHVFSFRSLAGFGTLPIEPSENLVFTDRGSMSFVDDSSYRTAFVGRPAGSDTYALAANGELALYVTGAGRDPTILFRGGYALTAAEPDLVFTDRVSNTGSPSIGLYLGTQVTNTGDDLAGDWHLLSLHVIFDQSQLAPDSVARTAFSRDVTIDAAPAAGESRAIAGTGTLPQTLAPLTFGGSIQKLLQAGGTGDGTCNLTISYQLGAQSPDSRVFAAAAGADIVLGLDEDQTDGEAGFAVLLRQFDPATAAADPASIAGTFLVGGYTVFVNAGDPGADAFTGVVTLTQQGAFRFDAVGSQGIAFSYQGTATYAQDGSMQLAIDSTNETWRAAIDRDYKTLVFLDDWQETRANGVIEYNFGFGVREKPE